MSTLLLHLPKSPAGPACDYSYALSRDALAVDSHGSAAAALLPASAASTVAVVSHEVLSWHQVNLPQGIAVGGRRGQARLRALLDGLLEERLLDEPALLHLAIAPHARAGQACWVAACDKSWLQGHLQALEAAGHSVSRIVPAYAPQAQAQLWAIGSADCPWLLATGLNAQESLACLPLAAGALAALGLPAETVVQAEPALARQAEALQQPVSLLTHAQGLLRSAAQDWDLAQFDLDLGSQSRAQRQLYASWQSFWRAPQWRAARWGLGLALVAQLIGLNAWAWKENQTIASKQAMVRQILSQTFPHVPLIIDAPVQMQREVTSLRQSSGALAGDDLEPLLATLARALPTGSPAQTLDYQDRRLTVKGLALPDTELEQAQQRLAGSAYALVRDGDALQLRLEARP